ncbi:MAG: ATP-binding cassette domain-containing protein [Planctomycetota bacterium]|nr:ATP-binding cassette domain-containing protein [Planctomycetota bacterium]
MSDAIEIQGVTKRFREKVAVDRLDLRVPAGSLCGFLGPNGAGKTTTIRMIMSIFLPDEGSIRVLGRASAVESKDRIGYLPEERGVYRKMKVGEFLEYMAVLKGVDRTGLSAKVDSWLERVALPDVRKKRCEELSKGMQQKVQFLAAIIHDPELIILDEPFSGLDPVNARLMRALIEELHREGRTIIFSTHVLHSAEQLCSRIFMINKGKKILDGSIDEIRSQFDPKTLVIEPLEGDGFDGAAESIRRVAGVQSVFHAGQRGTLEARLTDRADVGGVMRDIVSGAPVRRLELRRATLEDVFVHLVDPGDSEDVLRAMLSERGATQGLEVNADA